MLEPRSHSSAPRRRRRPVASSAGCDRESRVSHQLKRAIPTLELLQDAQLDEIELQADWLLEEIGFDILEDDESLQLFADAGAHVSGTRVRFEPGMVKALCSSAPSQFKMHGRDPNNTINIGGDSVVFLPGYGSPFVTCLDHGRRYAKLEDFESFVKLTYLSPWLHHSGGTVCEPVDVPVNKRHLDMVYAHLRYSTKPFMGSVTSGERAQDSVDMARLVFGADFMEQHCVIQGNININSPLSLDSTMSESLKAYARANQSVMVSPFILGGAMGPVTQPALIAQAHAEAMVGIALSQLVRPGAPVVYGNFLTTLDLRTGAPTFGTPEAMLSQYAMGQLARRLKLPYRCGGQLTAAKVADGQAMQESTTTMLGGLLAGANFVIHAAGWLEGGLTMGYEKFVMDLDHCGMLHSYLRGMNVDEESLAKDAYRQAGPGDNFLGVDHTLRHFRTANYESKISDNNSFEQWSEAGSLMTDQRANQIYKDMLAAYEPPDIEPSIDQALKDFIIEKKSSFEDRWY